LQVACEVDRARAPRGVIGPADGAAGDSGCALDPPLDALIGTCETVVDRNRPKVVCILEDVDRHSVYVRTVELVVTANAGDDAVRLAEQEAERVQVVDAHDQQGEALVRL